MFVIKLVTIKPTRINEENNESKTLKICKQAKRQEASSKISANPWVNTRLVKAADSTEIDFLESVVMVKVWVRVITQKSNNIKSKLLNYECTESFFVNLKYSQICSCNMLREENFEKKFVDFKLLQIDYSGFQCSVCSPQNCFSHQLIQNLDSFAILMDMTSAWYSLFCSSNAASNWDSYLLKLAAIKPTWINEEISYK